jgi:hypothetical protein
MENSKITQMIENLFPGQEVMWIYYGGSIAYGTKSDASDTDVIAVLSGLKGIIHAEAGGIDIFAYGYKEFEMRNHQDVAIPLYNRISSDDIVSAKDNLIYLNPNHEVCFNEFVEEKFTNMLPQFLDGFIEYFNLLVNSDKITVKRLYHIVRVRGILERFIETGKYSNSIPKGWKTKIKEIKDSWNDENMSSTYLGEIRTYLEEIKTMRKDLKP